MRRCISQVGAAALLVAMLAAPGAALAGPERGVMVLLKPGGENAAGQSDARASAQAVLARNSLERVRADTDEVGVMNVRLPVGESLWSFSQRLERDSEVAAVEPNVVRQLRLVPNDPALTRSDPGNPGYTYQWNLLRQNLPAAWDLALGSGVKVGVIDTGIDAGHPDLGSQLVAAVDQDESSTGTADAIGHGTHVSGLACGRGGNGFGIVGTGFDCQLIVEKTDLTGASIVASIVDATNRGAKVINMSFGGRMGTKAEVRALRYAQRKDVVLVAAAADSPEVNQGHPASDLQPVGTGPKIDQGNGLVVTAADETNRRAFFAGRGSQISIAAYGYAASGIPPGIFSSYPVNETQFDTGRTEPPTRPCGCRAVFDGSSSFAYLFGTSMAAPQVAGIAALVRSAAPSLPATAVVGVMKESASQQRWNTELGWGIVDAGAAVRLARAYAADTVAPVTAAKGRRARTIRRSIRLRWKGRDLAPAGVQPSGIAQYSVYAKRHRRYTLAGTTRKSSFKFKGARGARYSLYVQARDRAGNLERAPSRADFKIRVRR